MSLEISRAEQSNVTELISVLNEALSYKLAHHDLSWGHEAFTTKEVMPNIQAGDIFVARLNKQIVGSLILKSSDARIWGKQVPDALYVHRLAIRRGFHGLRLGAQLLNWASDQAKSQDRSFVRLDVCVGNQPLEDYYQNQGFKFIQQKTIKMPGDNYVATRLYERAVS